MCHLRPGEDLRAELKDTLRPEVRSACNSLLPTGQPAALLATYGCLCSSTGATGARGAPTLLDTTPPGIHQLAATGTPACLTSLLA